MTSQLERDLRNRCGERLFRVLCDLFELYDMAELSTEKAAQDILAALYTETTRLAASLDVDPNNAGMLMAQMIKEKKERIKRYVEKHGQT